MNAAKRYGMVWRIWANGNACMALFRNIKVTGKITRSKINFLSGFFYDIL